MTATSEVFDSVAADLHFAPAAGVPDDRWRRWFRSCSHRHAFDELAVCLRGTHGYGVGDHVVHAKPGAIWMMPAGLPHDALYGTPHESCLDLWVHLLPGGYASCNLAGHSPGRTLKVTPLLWPAGEAFMADAQRLRALLRAETVAHTHVEPKTAFFLCYFVSHLMERLSREPAPRSPPEQQTLMDEIKRYITENLSDDLHLKDLAKLAGYSPYHFHRLFAESQGCTPRQYVEQQRVRRGCALLEKGHTVTAAGLDAGFSSPADFSRIFRRVFGIPPTEWLRTRAQEL